MDSAGKPAETTGRSSSSTSTSPATGKGARSATTAFGARLWLALHATGNSSLDKHHTRGHTWRDSTNLRSAEREGCLLHAGPVGPEAVVYARRLWRSLQRQARRIFRARHRRRA